MAKKVNSVCPVCKDKYEVHENLAKCFEKYTELKAPQNDVEAAQLFKTYAHIKSMGQDQRTFWFIFSGENKANFSSNLPYDTMVILMNNKLASEEKEPDPEPEPEPEEPNEE